MASTGLGLQSTSAIVLLSAAVLGACGARSGLEVSQGGSNPGTTSVTSTGTTGVTATSTTGVTTSVSTTVVSSSVSSSTGGCIEGTTKDCGSNVGQCKFGKETCHNGVFGACEGGVTPKPEACNGLDENCNGTVNDCDPGSGPCTPTLFVTGSTPSSPNCIDFPVMMGSQGSFTYQCPGTGGAVTATLGGIPFMGTVNNNVVQLDGFATIFPPQTPDGCTWQDHHSITGSITSGTLTYNYSEMVIAKPPGVTCWNPCTEVGTVKITFP